MSDEAQRLGNKASRKVNRLGDRISDTAEDAENAVRVRLPHIPKLYSFESRSPYGFTANATSESPRMPFRS